MSVHKYTAHTKAYPEYNCSYSFLATVSWMDCMNSCNLLEGICGVYMFFVDLEKAFDRLPWGTFWGSFRSLELMAHCFGPFNLCNFGEIELLVSFGGNKSDLFPGRPPSAVLFIVFMNRISRHSQVAESVSTTRMRDGKPLCGYSISMAVKVKLKMVQFIIRVKKV